MMAKDIVLPQELKTVFVGIGVMLSLSAVLFLNACGSNETATNFASNTNTLSPVDTPTATVVSLNTVTPLNTTLSTSQTPENTTAIIVATSATTIPTTALSSPTSLPTEVPATAIPTKSKQTPVPSNIPVPPTAVSPTPKIIKAVLPNMETAIGDSKTELRNHFEINHQSWLELLPGMPGSKLFYYNTCGMQPLEGSQVNCKSNALATTTAVGNNGNWEITFSLTWPGQLPPGMKRAQNIHIWKLTETPNRQVKLVEDSGAPLPSFINPV